VALKPPRSGDHFTLAVDHGEGKGSLTAGTAIEVIDVVEPGTPGTGSAEGEKVVVFAAWESSTVLDDQGQPLDGIAVRHLSRPLSAFRALVA